jgi:hypothetical protein
MSIRVVCPNGHALKVKERLAGTSGLCPKCRARIDVPKLQPEDLSEDAILDILGPHQPGDAPDSSSIFTEHPLGGSSLSALSSLSSGPSGKNLQGSPPKKSCHKCHREIQAGTHICPHCHTYIANLGDF